MRQSGQVGVLLAATLLSAAGCASDDDLLETETPDADAALHDGGASSDAGEPGTDAAGLPRPGGGQGSPDSGSAGTGGDAGGTAADGGGDPHSGMTDLEVDPVCELPESDAFLPSTVGGGGAQFRESPHFRIFGDAAGADTALNHLEAAHKCFVEDWCFRSPGRSVHEADGPYYKFNVYARSSLGSAAGVMQYDARAGISYLEVINRSVPDPRVTVHELGHSLTLTEHRWVDQTRTGAWWETVANWVADTYLTSDYCEDGRSTFGVARGNTIINLSRNIGQSHLMIVSTQNYYEAWPFLTYLTNNPDNYPGLGRMAVLDLFRNHMRNNETPLHVLERIAAPVSVQTILGRYWARMAYLDIEHPQAREAFFRDRGRLDFANLDATGNQTYRVKAARRPAYGGANIIPLTGEGGGTVQVTNLGNGRQESNLTATLAIRATGGAVRYVALPDGQGQATIANNEEASLVVVNTPDTLYQYDAFRTTATSPESIGLNYEVRLTGATPSH